MKISSPFKDYYDFVAHQYGGGDPRVVYARTRLAPLRQLPGGGMVQDDVILEHSKEIEFPTLPRIEYYEYDTTKWLVIAGKLYLLVKDGKLQWSVLDSGKHPAMWAKLTKARYNRWSRFQPKTTADYIGASSETAITVSRILNAPVFVLTGTFLHNAPYHVEGGVPILAELGIPALITPEQMYQDIAYFIGNTMHVSPDMVPHTEMNDKEKIVAHGLDLVQSFRHRK